MSDVQSVADELLTLAQRLQRMPQLLSLDEIAALRRLMELLEYHIRYGAITPTVIFDEKQESSKSTVRRCSENGCIDSLRLWNINASRPNDAPDWRCIHHIPKEIGFPIGLWGEERESTGRKGK